MYYNSLGNKQLMRMRRPVIRIKSYRNETFILRASSILIPMTKYNLYIGRGDDIGSIILDFNPEGQYKFKIKPLMCTTLIAAYIGVDNETYKCPYEIYRNFLRVFLPSKRHEVRHFFRKLPEVLDNPADIRRRLAGLPRMPRDYMGREESDSDI